jgi:hypothetical protein
METLTPKSECPIKHHDTIVIGWNDKNEVVYIRTFDYKWDPHQAAEAQVALKWCVDNCAYWQISSTERLKFASDEDENTDD